MIVAWARVMAVKEGRRWIEIYFGVKESDQVGGGVRKKKVPKMYPGFLA